MRRTRRPDRLHAVVALLTFASGCSDAVALMALGGAFTSVITGNLIFVGRAVGTRSPSPAVHAALAVIGYIAGVAFGSLLTRFAWHRGAATLFFAESCIFAAANAAWLGYRADPPTAVRDALLTAIAAALGLQGAAARALDGAPSTTYMTGALTNLVMSFTAGKRRDADAAAAIGLVALVAGAACGAAIVTYAPAAALLPPLAAVLLATGRGLQRQGQDGLT